MRAGAALFLVVALQSSVAHADPHDSAGSEVLFDEGRRLMKAARYPEACAKFEASQRLDPGVGTLLNLGDCLEHAGRTASAWARFREAASLAVASSQTDREREARDRAQTLERRLVRLVVRPAAAASSDDGLAIVRDGVTLEREAWGAAVPVDPGKHVVRATSPGKIPWSLELEIESTPAGETRTIDVPALVAEPTSSWSTRKTVAVIVSGIGVATLGVGTGFAVDAKSSYDGARSRCTANGCDDAAQARADSAGNRADVATGLLIGGAVALAAGAVLFVTAPRQSKAWRAVGGEIRPTFAW